MDGFSRACYTFIMKRFCALLLMIIVALPFLFACSSETAKNTDALEIGETAAQVEGTPLPATAYGHNAGVKITASAAYVFEGVQGVAVYGAVEYENTGNCPIYISKAHFSFALSSGELEQDYTPPLSEYTIVLPGETSFVTIWIPRPSAQIGESVTLTASLTAVEAAVPLVSLEAGSLYVADNYPGVSTLSGKVSCVSSTGCSMNIIYVGFYDDNGAFLGAWYFSKNAVLETGDAKSFVVDMRDFPLSDLGARAAGFKAAAFGFDL